MNEITLFGFNNLTKSLSFSLYKLQYLTNHPDRYNAFIKERYSAEKLNRVLTEICHAIGGTVLNIAKQDYQPQGASVTLMISEELQDQPLATIASSHQRDCTGTTSNGHHSGWGIVDLSFVRRWTCM